MSVFEGIEQIPAEGTKSNHYFEPGNYLVQIDKAFVHKKRMGNGRLFIVETIVKQSDNSNIQAGEKRNWVQSLDSEYALPRIKSFVGAAMGLCPIRQTDEINSKITEELCNHIVGDENPLKGKIMLIRCNAKKSRAGKDFVQVNWRKPHGKSFRF